MRSLAKRGKFLIMLCLILSVVWSSAAWATSDDDNSLSGLGILTEGAVVSPEFGYGTVEYDVVVPAGTTSLSLDPVTTNSSAEITDISGTTLADDGTGTVYITVTAPNGDPFTYTLHVTREEAPETELQTEAQTEAQTEPQTEAATEDSRYVKVDKNTIQEAENTITELKSEITGYRETVTLYTRIMYGLIALSVLLLFIVINQALKRKDLKEELNNYRSLGYGQGTGAGSGRSTQSAPQQPQRQQVQQRRPQEQDQERRKAAPEGGQAGSANPRTKTPEVKPQVSRKAKTMPAYEQQDAPRARADEQAAQKAAAQKAKRQAEAEAAAAQKAKRQAEAAQRREAAAREREEAAALKAEQRQDKAQAKAARAQRKAQEKAIASQERAMAAEAAKARRDEAVQEKAAPKVTEAPVEVKTDNKDVQINMVDL